MWGNGKEGRGQKAVDVSMKRVDGMGMEMEIEIGQRLRGVEVEVDMCIGVDGCV